MLTQQRVIRLITIFLLSGWLILFAASRIFILQGFDTLETKITATQIDRVTNAISEKLNALSSKNGDWAFWDESYNFVNGTYPEFIPNELEDATFVQLEINLMMVVKPSGQLVYAKSVDLVTGQGAPFQYANSIKLDSFLKSMDASSRLTGVVLLPNGPMLISVDPILPSNLKGPPAGALIFGRYLDDAELDRIGATTHLTLDVYRLDLPLMDEEQRIARASISDTNPNFIHARNDQQINGYRILQDINDQPILLLRIQQSRDIYQEGLSSVLYFMLAISAIGIIFAGVFFSLTDRLIESRHNLRASEQKYSILFHQAAIPAVLVQLPENSIADINTAFEETFGYHRDEIIGKDWREIGIATSTEQARIQTKFQRETWGNKNEIHLLTKAGNTVITPLNVSLVKFGGHRFAIATIHDLTDRKRAEEQLQALSRRLVELQETERRSLARELHDEIGQALTAVKMNLQSTQFTANEDMNKARLAESIRIVEHTLRQTRDLSLDLRPSHLDDFGLVAALEWYLKREAERSDIVLSLEVEPHGLRLSALLETACYRITQSAITNIIRHAHAKNVRVELRMINPNLVELIIQDDGIGFDVTRALNQARHGASMGLLTMQERAQLVGGEIDFVSEPTRGTCIRATFPTTE